MVHVCLHTKRRLNPKAYALSQAPFGRTSSSSNPASCNKCAPPKEPHDSTVVSHGLLARGRGNTSALPAAKSMLNALTAYSTPPNATGVMPMIIFMPFTPNRGVMATTAV